MVEKDNLDNPMIAVVGVVSVVLTIASVIGVQTLYVAYSTREADRKTTAVPANSASKLAEQDAKLARYAWADREKGQVVIPIERAMSLTVKEYLDRAANDDPQPTPAIAKYNGEDSQ